MSAIADRDRLLDLVERGRQFAQICLSHPHGIDKDAERWLAEAANALDKKQRPE